MYSCAPLIREIGRGKEGARSLSREQARELWTAMLNNEVSDLELGAILIALRVKGESREELAGFCEATQTCLPRISVPVKADRPTLVFPSYNGARRRPNLLPLLAGALARLGYPVLIHGHVEDPTGRITTADVFSELRWPKSGFQCGSSGELFDVNNVNNANNVNDANIANPQESHIARSVNEAADQVIPQTAASPEIATGCKKQLSGDFLSTALAHAHNQRWPLFVDVAHLHPGLLSLLNRRKVLGVRNATHTIVKLIQPVVEPSLLVTSYTHPEFWHLQRDVLAMLNTSALVIRGHEGEAVAHPQKAPRMDAVFSGETACADEGDAGFTDMPERNPDRNARHTAEQTLELLVKMDREGLDVMPPGLVRQIRAIEALAARCADRHVSGNGASS